MFHSDNICMSKLEHCVNAKYDPVTGGNVKLEDGCGALAGPHRHALAVDVIQAPGHRELAAPGILQLSCA